MTIKITTIFSKARHLLFIIFVSFLVACGSASNNERDNHTDNNIISWKTTFGGSSNELGTSVKQTADGGYIILGSTRSYGAGNADVYLVKTDENGNVVWDKTFGGSDYDYGNSVRETSDGGYIIVGETGSYGAGQKDVYLIKTDANGSAVWKKTFGGSDDDIGFSVQQIPNGDYIITGQTRSYGAGQEDVYLIKTDMNGTVIWEKTFGGSDNDVGYSVQRTSDKGYIIAGITNSYGSGATDFYLIKTDANGNAIWERTFGGVNDEWATSVQQTSDEGYIISGYKYNLGFADVYLIKTDANGNAVWEKTFGGSGNDISTSVQQTTDGGYIVVGITWAYGADDSDVYLIKTDATGSTVWERTFGGVLSAEGRSVQQTSDGGYIATGWKQTHRSIDVFLIKTDTHGIVK